MNQHNVEYYNFSTWKLIKSNKEDFNKYNKGFINDNSIGFFHEIGMNVNTGFIFFAKPKYTYEEFVDSVGIIKGLAIFHNQLIEDINNNNIIILDTFLLCNN